MMVARPEIKENEPVFLHSRLYLVPMVLTEYFEKAFDLQNSVK